jgi:hypothetical protein
MSMRQCGWLLLDDVSTCHMYQKCVWMFMSCGFSYGVCLWDNVDDIVYVVMNLLYVKSIWVFVLWHVEQNILCSTFGFCCPQLPRASQKLMEVVHCNLCDQDKNRRKSCIVTFVSKTKNRHKLMPLFPCAHRPTEVMDVGPNFCEPSPANRS